MKALYLCNGKNPKCNKKPGCYFFKEGPDESKVCWHTADPLYAKNTVVRHPEKSRRFVKVSEGLYLEVGKHETNS